MFSVSHSGLHDVKAHWKGKKHLQLQEHEMEKSAEERIDRRGAKGVNLVFNEEVRVSHILLDNPLENPCDNQLVGQGFHISH